MAFRFGKLVVLAFLLQAFCGCSQKEATKSGGDAALRKGFESPEEAFESYEVAARKMDISSAFASMTESSVNCIAGEGVLDDLSRLRSSEGTDDPAREKVIALFAEHGVDIDSFESALPEGGDTYAASINRRIKAGSLVKDKAALLTKLLAIHSSQVRDTTNLPKKELSDVVVEGDFAAAASVWEVEGQRHFDPVFFQRVNGRWFVHRITPDDTLPEQLTQDFDQITARLSQEIEQQDIDRGSRVSGDPEMDSSGDSIGEQSKPPTLRVAFVSGIGSLNSARGAAAAAQELGIELTFLVPEWEEDSPRSQRAILAGLLQEEFDGVVLDPAVDADLSEPLSKLIDKTKVVTIYDDNTNGNRHAHVGTDPIEFGRSCGRLLTKALPQGGRVLVIGGGSAESQGFAEGVHGSNETTSDAQGGEFDIFESPFLDGHEVIRIAHTVRDMLKNDTNIDAVVGLSPVHAIALPHIGVADRQVPIISMATDENLDALLAIEEEHAYGLVAEDLFGMGYEAIRTIHSLATSERVVSQNISISITPRIVTEANVEETRLEWSRIDAMNNPLDQPASARSSGGDAAG